MRQMQARIDCIENGNTKKDIMDNVAGYHYRFNYLYAIIPF